MRACASQYDACPAAVVPAGWNDSEPKACCDPHAPPLQASLVEVELAQGASPLVSPRNGGSGSGYSNWLRD